MPDKPYRINLSKNGAKRIRTADTLHAMQVLYQLSYSPLSLNNCNRLLDLSSRKLHNH